MNNLSRESGIEALGNIPWGSHFCQFYSTTTDLIETLVPYFEAGLRNNESCFWIASKSLGAQQAEALMVDAVPDFKKYIYSGQMEIVSISDSYTAGGTFNTDALVQGWLDKEAESKQRGFAGLRATGDSLWVERSGWADFMEYERQVNESFRNYNLVALCTYCMDNCTASDVIDVCCNHQFALTRRAGNWELIESSSLKMVKESLLSLNARLEARVDERTTALNSALQARDDFLAMLGHELRNPLASIQAASDVIRLLTPSSSLIADNSFILHRQVKHLTRLVNDLLDVARINQGQIQLELSHVILADVISMAVEQSRPMIDQRFQSFSVTLPNRLVTVYADATRLAQVFGNLLHNAAKYTPNGGKINITSHASDSEVIVSVKDSGSGIPTEILTTIFDLFTQSTRSLDRSDGGLGVGLTVAKRIVDMHLGSITAQSNHPDEGSEFLVSLPLSKLPLSEAPIQEFKSNLIYDNQLRILVVDDNRDARVTISSLLSIHGHEVKLGWDSESAFALAKSFKPDIVFLDIGLPGMNGYEIAQQLRNMPELKNTKLIALTGYGKRSDVSSAEQAGFDSHMLKPAELDVILSKIKEVYANVKQEEI